MITVTTWIILIVLVEIFYLVYLIGLYGKSESLSAKVGLMAKLFLGGLITLVATLLITIYEIIRATSLTFGTLICIWAAAVLQHSNRTEGVIVKDLNSELESLESAPYLLWHFKNIAIINPSVERPDTISIIYSSRYHPIVLFKRTGGIR